MFTDPFPLIISLLLFILFARFLTAKNYMRLLEYCFPIPQFFGAHSTAVTLQTVKNLMSVMSVVYYYLYYLLAF